MVDGCIASDAMDTNDAVAAAIARLRIKDRDNKAIGPRAARIVARG
jgi:hypothetical protein